MNDNPMPQGAASFSLWGKLFEPRSIAGLVFFRVTLGLVLALHPLYMLAKDQVDYFYVWPSVFFPHPGFDWLPPASDQAVYACIGIMLATGLMISAGFLYRLSATAHALAWGYLFFLERTNYHNQHYLIFLLAVLLAVIPAHRSASVDAWLRPSLRRPSAPAWAYWILRFQIAMPFIFGGLIKLQPDWLAGRPALFIWASGVAARPWYGAFNPELMSMLIAYGGIVVDLIAVPLLLIRRTRMLGFIITLGFHLANLAIMGGTPLHLWMFPWIMIPAATIYFDPDWPQRLRQWIRSRRGGSAVAAAPVAVAPSAPTSAWHGGISQIALLTFIGIYVVLQLLLPIRHYLSPGPVIWNHAGGLYAWTMILSLSNGSARIEVTDPASGQTFNHDPELILSPYQAQVMSRRPDMMWAYARMVADRYERWGQPGVEVRFTTQISLNGRPPQRYIDPDLDLLEVSSPAEMRKQILPLKHPLPPLREAAKDVMTSGLGL